MATRQSETDNERAQSTRSVHGGSQRIKGYHSLTTPIVQTATYTFRNTQELVDFMESKTWGDGVDRGEYGRYGNPTIAAVESRLAELDAGEDAVLYGSGMAAITTLLLAVLPSGAHIVMTDDCYRRTRQFCQTYLRRLGIDTSIVPAGDYDTLESAIRPGKTRFLITESPTNPYLHVVDMERFAAIGKRSRTLTIIDSTFATPVNQRPLEWGVDFVMHSATKYLSGHNDMMGGVIVGRSQHIRALKDARGVLGSVLDPHSAYLLERGIKTLGLRVQQQNATALNVANFLEEHPAVEQVWYPGLPAHPEFHIAKEQMTGYGGVVSFTIHGDLQRTSRFIDRLRIPYIAPSLGGVESLIEQPALMSYYEKTPRERQELNMHDNLVRFAVGIEDTEDLIADLTQALEAVS